MTLNGGVLVVCPYMIDNDLPNAPDGNAAEYTRCRNHQDSDNKQNLPHFFFRHA